MCQQQHCEVRDRQFRASHCLKEFFKVKHSKPDTIIIAQQSPANTTTKSEPRTKTLPNSSQTTVFLNHSQTTNRFETRTENVKHTGEELHVLQLQQPKSMFCTSLNRFLGNMLEHVGACATPCNSLQLQSCKIHHFVKWLHNCSTDDGPRRIQWTCLYSAWGKHEQTMGKPWANLVGPKISKGSTWG